LFRSKADQFRFTVDLRTVNKVTIPSSWPIPHLDYELNRVAGSSVFTTFDLSQGYWQLSLDAHSQECQSFITPDGVFTPTRVLHVRLAVDRNLVGQAVINPVSALSITPKYALTNAYKVGWGEVGGSMVVYRLDKVGYQLPTVLCRALVLCSIRLSTERDAAPYVIKSAARHAGLPSKGGRNRKAVGRLCFPKVSSAAKLVPVSQENHTNEF
jgi:hypothetical protein